MDNVYFASKLRQLCEENKVSITKMVRDCGLSRNIMYDLEKRDSTPNANTITKIAEYFDVSVDYLTKSKPLDDTTDHQPLSRLIKETVENLSPGNSYTSISTDSLQDLLKAYDSYIYTLRKHNLSHDGFMEIEKKYGKLTLIILDSVNDSEE